MPTIAPSILSADFSNLEKEFKKLKTARYLHLDVMDGHFVPNITFGPCVVKSIRKITDMVFDTHLMIAEPDLYLDDFIEAGADIITVHYEAVKHIHRTVNYIKRRGLKAGVALNPATPLSSVEEILLELDLLLIMSVNPGFGGQKFIPSALDKLRRARKLIDEVEKETGKKVLLEIDGGVNLHNIDEIVKCGVDIIVAGSAVFKGNAEKNLKQLQSHCE